MNALIRPEHETSIISGACRNEHNMLPLRLLDRNSRGTSLFLPWRSDDLSWGAIDSTVAERAAGQVRRSVVARRAAHTVQAVEEDSSNPGRELGRRTLSRYSY